MPNKETFEYAFIRFVPRVEREEFMNIGVIVFSKRNNFLDVKFNIDKERLKAFSPDFDSKDLEKYLHSWSLISQGSPEGGTIAHCEIAYRFRWLTANRSTIIQSSKVHPGISEDPAKVLEDLFSKYVL